MSVHSQPDPAAPAAECPGVAREGLNLNERLPANPELPGVGGLGGMDSEDMLSLMSGEIDWRVWFAHYAPRPNVSGPTSFVDAHGRTTLYRPCGRDWLVVQEAAAQAPHSVWTLLDCEGGQSIVNGFHVQHCQGYFLTDKPWSGSCTVFLDAPDLDAQDAWDDVQDGQDGFDHGPEPS